MRRRTWQRLLTGGMLLLLFCLAARFTGVSLPRFWSRRAHLGDIFARMCPPEWSFLPRLVWPLWSTLQMSLTGTALGSALALGVAPLCSANLCPAPLPRWILRCFIQFLRSFPTLILALAATFVFGLGAFAGTAAITVYTFAIMTRLTYEDIESAPLGACHALRSMGVSLPAAYVQAVVPEIGGSCLTNVLYLLEANVRHSAILGYVGAGGVGLLLNEKISWLEYDRVGTILLSLLAVVCLIELLSAWLTTLIRGDRRPGRAGKALLPAAAVLLLAGLFSLEGPDFSHTIPHTALRMLSGLVHPDWELVLRADSSGLGWLLLETGSIALTGTALGAVISLPLALLGSGRLCPRPVALLFRGVSLAVRSIPVLIWGLILIRVTGPGAFTGVLTMAVCSVGLLTKRFTEAIDTLDMRPWNALSAMGVRPLHRLRHCLLPQLAPALRSAVLYRFDVNLREASVLGIVGAGGIGAPLIFAMNHYDWSQAGTICLGLAAMIWAVDGLSSRLRRNS